MVTIYIMDIDNTKRFVVVKFVNEDGDCDEEDDSLFEVGLTKWLKELDDENNAKISWPPKSEQSTAIKKQTDALPSWPIYNVTVLKSYDLLLAARNARNGYIISSNYETECEFGRGKRKKISTKVTQKKKNTSTSDDSDFDNGVTQKKCKQSAPSPPVISFRSNKNEAKKNTKGSKTKNNKLLQKNYNKLEEKNDAMLTSRQNHKARKDFLLTKISQAKKVTSAMDNKSKIIETTRQKHKCMIEDDTKIVSDATDEENLDPNIVRKDFSMEVQEKEKVSSADKNHKVRKDFLLTKISQAKKVTSAMDNKSKIIETARQKHKCMVEDDTKIVSDATDEENLNPNIVRKDFSMEVQEKKKVSSADNNISQKTSARSVNIETPAGTSKDNFTYGSDTSGEKSPSSICNAYSPSELRQMSPVTSHMTALASSSSTPRLSRQSGSRYVGATYDMKDFEKKMYVSNQEISSKLDMLIMNICRLNRFLLPHEKRIVRPAHFPALPMTTEEELEKFEKYLSKDDNAAATICYVSQIIGPKDNIKEAVYKVLKKLISNTLAAQFTLKAGKNVSKKCFEKLALYEVVQGAILDKRPETELPEIDVATSLWLKQAPWRRQDDGSMGKRTKK